MRADAQKVKKQLHIAAGQIEGIEKMVDADAYCVDISNQLLACIAVLKRLNAVVLSAHLEGCVLEAAKKGEEKELATKVQEVQKLLERMSD